MGDKSLSLDKFSSERYKKNEEYLAMTPAQLQAKIHKLEKEMYEHAHQLEFEEAAKIRDVIKEMERALVR